MPDDQQGFHPGGCLRKKIPQGVYAGGVERSFEFAGRFLRQFTQDHVERIARAPCRRNEGEIENETGCAKIGAHSRRVGVALNCQWPLRIAFGSVSRRFGMANEEEPAQLFPCASATETAVMLMMPRAVTEGVRIWAGLAAPIRIGPTGKVSAMIIVIV
jgi:hypothetical protein